MDQPLRDEYNRCDFNIGLYSIIELIFVASSSCYKIKVFFLIVVLHLQETDMPFVSDQDLLSQIIVQAKNAFADANAHKDDYVSKRIFINSWVLIFRNVMQNDDKNSAEVGSEIGAAE